VVDTLLSAISSNVNEFSKPGVLAVRPGFQVVGGWPTRKPAIVVTVERKTDALLPTERLPETVDGIAVDVREASPLRRLQITNPAAYEQVASSLPPEQRLPEFPDEVILSGVAVEDVVEALESRKPQLAYTSPAGALLHPVEDDFDVLCHASPDAGFPTLRTFLAATREHLAVGIYDFTSAHVLDALKRAIEGRRLDLVLDHPALNHTADQSDEDTRAALAEALENDLRFAWALERNNPFAAAAIFPNAYHIKVAVQDQESFWLSSGNWNNSNQPDIDPLGTRSDESKAREADRDWHVIVRHPGLAATFARFLENDLNVAFAHQASDPAAPSLMEDLAAFAAESLEVHPFAQFFPPRRFTDRMRITPLLTPDPGVYVDAVTELVRGAQHRLYVQTQYAHPSVHAEDQAFSDLLAAVVDRQQKGVDVRIIFSQWERSDHLEKLQAVGFDLAQVRVQQGVHNKGIIRDSDAVLISSQNWSGDGVLRNRDAGVIIENADVNEYFAVIFLHDWTNLARQKALDA
jgi:hypothetical protein